MKTRAYVHSSKVVSARALENVDLKRVISGLVYTACYERTELIIYVARSGTLVACIFDLYVTTVSEPNASWEKLNMF